MRDEQAEGGNEARDVRGGPHVPEDEAIEDEADERADDHHGEQERRA